MMVVAAKRGEVPRVAVQGEGDSGGAAIAAPGDSRGNAIAVEDDGVRRVGRDAAHDHSRDADQVEQL